MVAVAGFKRYLWALGTVGSSAPFVGLFGTVVGILKAFQSMSQAGTGGFKVVSQGIAAALVATAAGLLVAIYAIIAYNYFVAKIGTIGVQYKVFCEEFLFALGDLGKTQGQPVRQRRRRPRTRRRLRRSAIAMAMNVQIEDASADDERRGRGQRIHRRRDQHHAAHRRVPRPAHHLHGDLHRHRRIRGQPRAPASRSRCPRPTPRAR